jgi:hypothetical protein
MTNPDAAFDVLYMATRLQYQLGNVADAELHLFGYLSCLLSLYRGNPIADWGYGFAGTKNGSPFSADLQDATRNLELNACLSREDDHLQITHRGASELEILTALDQNARRTQYLEGASSSLLALPVGMIREAILFEPTLRPAGRLDTTRLLLTGVALDLLYDQFDLLNQAVGLANADLLVPSTVWLTYLAQSSEAYDVAKSYEGQDYV